MTRKSFSSRMILHQEGDILVRRTRSKGKEPDNDPERRMLSEDEIKQRRERAKRVSYKDKQDLNLVDVECPQCMKEFPVSWDCMRTSPSLECPHCHFLISCDKILSDLNEQWEEESRHESKGQM